jgi:hypothetical protein
LSFPGDVFNEAEEVIVLNCFLGFCSSPTQAPLLFSCLFQLIYWSATNDRWWFWGMPFLPCDAFALQ